MKTFVNQLVMHLSDPRHSMSRNRHFDTFATPQGRRALRVHRQLRSLAMDILESAKAGNPIRVERVHENGKLIRILLELERLKVRRTTFLSPEEYEILVRNLPIREALERAR